MQYLVIMFAAGLGIPVLAALNAGLGRWVGSPAIAATVLFAVAFGAAALVTFGMGAQGWAKIASAPKHLFFAGVLIAFYVLSITWIAPVIGIGNAVFMVLLGQIVAAAVIDHFGLFGAVATPLSWARMGGIAVMTAGIVMVQRA